MKLIRRFPRCVFDAVTIKQAAEVFADVSGATDAREIAIRSIAHGSDTWSFDSDDEFFGAYAQGFASAHYYLAPATDAEFEVRVIRVGQIETSVEIRRPERAEIERIQNVFQERVGDASVPNPPPEPPDPPTIFIGHGGSTSWRDLKDHLQDLHGYRVEAYETGARAGHVIRDILQDMTLRSTFAVLVMTAEDQQPDGTYRARENVVHEVGLFQGTLGFDRAIVAIEAGIEPFSNLQGIHQLRFSGNIKEIFGDVLATLKREFPQSAR